MTVKEPSVPKLKMVTSNGSERYLAIQYAELLRLRQAVRQAELLAGGGQSDSARLKSKLN